MGQQTSAIDIKTPSNDNVAAPLSALKPGIASNGADVDIKGPASDRKTAKANDTLTDPDVGLDALNNRMSEQDKQEQEHWTEGEIDDFLKKADVPSAVPEELQEEQTFIGECVEWLYSPPSDGRSVNERVRGWIAYAILGLFVISVSAIVWSSIKGITVPLPITHTKPTRAHSGRLQPHVSASEMSKRILARHQIEVVCSNSLMGDISTSLVSPAAACVHDESLWFLHRLLSCPVSVCSSSRGLLRLVLVNGDFSNDLNQHPEWTVGSKLQQIVLPIDATSNATQLVPLALQVYESLTCLRDKLQCRIVRSHSTSLVKIASMVSDLGKDPALCLLRQKYDLSLLDFELADIDAHRSFSRPPVSCRSWKTDTIVLTPSADASDIDQFLMFYV